MHTETFPRVSGIILAGGQSRRMGHDKALLDFQGVPFIARVVERVQAVCTETIIVANNGDVYARILSGACPESFDCSFAFAQDRFCRRVEGDVRVVGDVYPGKGSLGGIFSGLQAAREEYALAVACDMPFLNQALLRYLTSLIPEFDVVIPRARDASSKTPRSSRGDKPREGTIPPLPEQPIAKERDLHPMHAVYSKDCLAAMEARLQANDLRAISFHDAVRVRVVEPEEVDQFDPQHLSFFNVNTPDDLRVASQLVNQLISQPIDVRRKITDPLLPRH